MRGKKKKSRVGTSQGGMRSLLGTRAGFWGSRGRWLLATVPPHAGLNGPQATAGGPSLITFTHPDAPRPYYRGARRAAPQRAL